MVDLIAGWTLFKGLLVIETRPACVLRSLELRDIGVTSVAVDFLSNEDVRYDCTASSAAAPTVSTALKVYTSADSA